MTREKFLKHQASKKEKPVEHRLPLNPKFDYIKPNFGNCSVGLKKDVKKPKLE
jgi:hypothetical protein